MHAGGLHIGLGVAGGLCGTSMVLPPDRSWISGPGTPGYQTWYGYCAGPDLRARHPVPGLPFVSVESTVGYGYRRISLPEHHYPADAHLREHYARAELLSRWWLNRALRGPNFGVGAGCRYILGGELSAQNLNIEYHKAMRGAEYYLIGSLEYYRRVAVGGIRFAMPLEVLATVDISVPDTHVFELGLRVGLARKNGVGEQR
jgi:hypothetical protein